VGELLARERRAGGEKEEVGISLLKMKVHESGVMCV
jgi:hypothetical protein